MRHLHDRHPLYRTRMQPLNDRRLLFNKIGLVVYFGLFLVLIRPQVDSGPPLHVSMLGYDLVGTGEAVTLPRIAVVASQAEPLYEPCSEGRSIIDCMGPPPPVPEFHPSSLGPEDIYVIVEEMPELIGGLSSLAERIRYPGTAKKAGVEGRVIVQFIVDEAGNVTDPVVVRGVGAGCDEEAIRAVEQVTFIPGKQKGVKVKVRMSIPITFRLG